MPEKLPSEIAELDARISDLRAKRTALYDAWIDSIAPLKRGQRVRVVKGNAVRNGVVESQLSYYENKWEYTVRVELKKGGNTRIRVYSWDRIEPLTEGGA